MVDVVYRRAHSSPFDSGISVHLLLPASQNEAADIAGYINTPGGSVTGGPRRGAAELTARYEAVTVRLGRARRHRRQPSRSARRPMTGKPPGTGRSTRPPSSPACTGGPRPI